MLKLRPQIQHEALQTARTRQATSEFKQQYRQRALVEGAFSQACLRFGIRRTRYIGIAKTHLQHVLTAAAMNLARLVSWLDDVPKTKTRQSPECGTCPHSFCLTNLTIANVIKCKPRNVQVNPLLTPSFNSPTASFIYGDSLFTFYFYLFTF